MKYILNDAKLIEEAVNQGILNTPMHAGHKVWISVFLFNHLNSSCKQAIRDADPPWLEIGELSWELMESAGLLGLSDGKISYTEWVHISEAKQYSGILITRQPAVALQAEKTGIKVFDGNSFLQWIKYCNGKPKPVNLKMANRPFNESKVSDLRAKQTMKNK